MRERSNTDKQTDRQMDDPKEEPLGMTGAGLYRSDDLPVTHPTVSKH